MDKELFKLLNAALKNEAPASGNFSSEDVNEAAINAILTKVGLSTNATSREIRKNQDTIFALIEESVDEVLPKSLEGVLQEFAEVKQFARDAEISFNIEKVGKGRAKLTIMQGARNGIYKAAKLSSRYFSPVTKVYTVAVAVTAEELMLGTLSLGELYSNILDGFKEQVYLEVFNALAAGTPALGTSRIGGNTQSTTLDALGAAIDTVLPIVKQYGVPTIFGSYQTVSTLLNDADASHVDLVDSAEKRQYGYIQTYKTARVVELPNYLIGTSNDTWFYDPKYVFVLPSGIKPVKVALKGDLTLKRNADPVGGEKWEAHKIMGVGLAMANNYAVITVTDLA